MLKYLKTDDEKCAGCLECVSFCSKLYFKEDNPAKSAIAVEAGRNGKFHLVVCAQTCGACIAECPTQAIGLSKSGVVLINAKKCVGCLACVSVCPLGAMRWYPGLPVPFKCTACGSCAATCPKGALELVVAEGGGLAVQKEVPR